MTRVRAARPHIHLPSAKGRRLRVLTDLVAIRLTGADTGGAYAIVERWTPPLGGAVEFQRHPPRVTFLVLEGIFEHRGIGPEGPYVLRSRTGDVVRIAAGAPYGYQNIGPSDGHLLEIIEPPGQMLALYEALDAAVDHPDPVRAPPDLLPTREQLYEIFEAHDVHLVPMDEAERSPRF